MFRKFLLKRTEVLAATLLVTGLVVLTGQRAASFATGTCIAPPSGMVAWLPGDGNANDISGNNNNGTLQNGATFASGMVGQAFSFDGINDFVGVPDNPKLNAQTLTLDAWVKTGAVSNIFAAFIVAKSGGNGLSGYEFGVFPKNGALRFTLEGGASGADLIGATSVVDNQFHHVAATYDGQMMKIYLDGQLEAQKSVQITISYPLNRLLIIGKREGDPNIVPEVWNGLIDELEIFDRALSQTEIQAIVNAGSAGICRTCTPPPSGMVSWWPGDDNALDIQGSNNGILQNGATFAAGKVGQAFSLDGIDDRVDVADNSTLNPGTGSFTVDAWVFKTHLQSSMAIAPVIAKHVGDFRNGYLLDAGSGGTGLPTTNEIEAAVGDASGNRIAIGTSVNIPLNMWVHLAMSYDSLTKSLRAYKDGVLIGSGSNSLVGSIDPSGQLFRIGSYNRTSLSRVETFPGLIDEVEFFNRALSASEIQAIVNAGNAGKCKDTIPPTFTSVPADVTAYTGAGGTDGCGKIISDATLGTATATDNSPGTVTITRSGVPAGNFFLVGNTTITYTATDAAGNTATATQKVTVIDNTAPIVTAPANINRGTGLGATACSLFISNTDLGTASATDNCSSFMVTTSGVPSGNIFPVGTTTITYTATDVKRNTATATQTVIVTDTTPPTITAPPNATYQCVGDVPSAKASDATATDFCSTPTVTVSETSNGGSGSPSSPLILTRTFTATDAAGNSASATQTITVKDDTAPVVTCPANLTVTAAAGSTSAVVSYPSPTATDNCSGAVTLTSSPASGSSFPLGTTTVTVTATDAAGNSSSCSFTVTVQAQQTTAIEAINALIDKVNALVSAGVLNSGEGNSLTSKLRAAIQQLQKGNVTPAVNQLKAFINEVEALTKSGRLTNAQAQPLNDAANAVITQLGG